MGGVPGVPVRVLAAWSVAAASLLAPVAASAEDTPPCPPAGDAVVVVVASHALWLCVGGAPEAQFPVALGRSGVGKRHRGDGRTPLGTYGLGAPRASEEYGTFIPIAYPTPDQAAHGFTGSAIGIHGPPRGMDEPDYPVTEVDWTLGCIATGTDEAVGAVAAFVRARQARIEIR